MKYLRYIINDKPINPENAGVMGVPVGIIALPVLTVFIFGAGVMDGIRYHKLRYRRRQRELRNIRYIRSVLRSLGYEETRDNIEMLKAV